MEQQKIVFVSHCALNTAAKVQRSAQEGEQEEKLRREFFALGRRPRYPVDSAALPGIYPLWRKPLGSCQRTV